MSGDVGLVCLSCVDVCESSCRLRECIILYLKESCFHSVVNKVYLAVKDKPLNGSPCSFSRELFTDYQVITEPGLTLVVDNVPSCYSAQSIFRYLSSALSADCGYIEIRFTKQGPLIRGYLRMPSVQKLNAALHRSEKLRMGDNPLLVYPYYCPPMVFLRTVGSTYYCGIHGLPDSWNSQMVKSFLLTMTPVRSVKKVGNDWEFYTAGLRLLRSCFPTRDDVFLTEKKNKIAWWRLLESEYAMEPKPEESQERHSSLPGMELRGLPGSYDCFTGREASWQAVEEYPRRGKGRYVPTEPGESYRGGPRGGQGGEFVQEGGERRGMARREVMRGERGMERGMERGRERGMERGMDRGREQGEKAMGRMRGQGMGRQTGPFGNPEMRQGMSQFSNQSVSQPLNQFSSQPVDQFSNQSVNQPVNQFSQPMNQFIQPMNQFANQQPMNQFNQPMNQFNQPMNQFNQPMNQFNQPINQFANQQPMNQPATQPLNAYYSYDQQLRANQATQPYQPLESSPSGVLLEGFSHRFNQNAVVRLLRSFGAVDYVRFVDSTTA